MRRGRPDGATSSEGKETMEARERVFELHIKDGRVAVDLRTVRPRWTADKPVVLHLRGYAIERKVTPGGNAEVTFKADVTGRFPVAALSGPRPHGPGRRGPLVMVEIYPR